MRTIMWTASSLEGNDPLGTNRIERTKNYLNYYRKLKNELGFDQFIFADNCSHWERLSQLGATPYHERSFPHQKDNDCFLYRFEERIERGSRPQEYPFVWRAFYFVNKLFELPDVDKILLIDSDAFVLSPEMARYIRNLKSGYTAFWCPRYPFPLTEISVLCKDAFPLLKEWFKRPWQDRAKEEIVFEHEPPFTHVEKKFKGSRYGELFLKDHPTLAHEAKGNPHLRGWPQTDDMDFYTQAQLKIPLTFRG